ncbi:hypothetical protein FFLO_00194 [Filobasidium floriforme]|uniref:MICOS complex subunit MIC10 n=1 Tax=Filobasidium floriforme TaxID=5210 RepID=A0A8K0NR55_9TREE|nr:hypothetical protein FFLO_00194 [Filobasidium floriforme]
MSDIVSAPSPIPSPPAAVRSVASEDVVARKTCSQLADFVVSSGIGFSVGVVASVLLFRRRGWPVALSTGFGAGVAYQNCNASFNPYLLPGHKVLSADAQPTTSALTQKKLV